MGCHCGFCYAMQYKIGDVLDLHQVALYWRAKRAKRRRERSEPSVAKRRAGSREAASASDEVARGRLVPLAGI